MGRELPTWSDALFVANYGSVRVGIFPSIKPWVPRSRRQQRFLAVDAVDPARPDAGPFGGMALPGLSDAGASYAEHDGVAVLACEAEGTRSGSLIAPAPGWVLVLAVDAWVAIGPSSLFPEALQIGPRVIGLGHRSGRSF